MNEPVEQIRSLAAFGDPSVPVAINYGQNRYGTQLALQQHEISVTNARSEYRPDSLSARGFALTQHVTAVTDFRDPLQIEHVYAAEVKELIKRQTGCEKVIVFHNQLRDNHPDAGMDIRKPVQFCHVDYDEDTYRIRIREVLRDEADYWLNFRFAAFNVWRGLDTVEEKPLAICDASTVQFEDMRRVEIHERPGTPTPYSGMTLTFNTRHRWYYYRSMQPDEAVIFKQCDTDHNRVRWCPHVAVDDNTSSRPRPRVSFEARTIAFFKA